MCKNTIIPHKQKNYCKYCARAYDHGYTKAYMYLYKFMQLNEFDSKYVKHNKKNFYIYRLKDEPK